MNQTKKILEILRNEVNEINNLFVVHPKLIPRIINNKGRDITNMRLQPYVWTKPNNKGWPILKNNSRQIQNLCNTSIILVYFD